MFDAVLQRAMTAGTESVPFDVEDLPGYAGAVFDPLVARPDLMRPRLWKLLERPSATGREPDAFRRKATEVADAQQRGEVAEEMEAADLLTMVLAAAQAWFWAATGIDPEEVSQSWSARRPALHRSAVVEAARRMCEPKTVGE
ncbi:TetR/AcrR family transcriptional regulator [Streptomyces sp. NPDC088400]|uniref:TetR/AcrR family transcriptional regulator n=1 Tax=Streptomyces sp. NPDC088400 TaxID=3365861 RepID=UPI0037FBD097